MNDFSIRGLTLFLIVLGIVAVIAMWIYSIADDYEKRYQKYRNGVKRLYEEHQALTAENAELKARIAELEEENNEQSEARKMFTMLDIHNEEVI